MANLFTWRFRNRENYYTRDVIQLGTYSYELKS